VKSFSSKVFIKTSSTLKGWRTLQMNQRIDWTQVLVQCKNNVQKQIAPLFETLKQPQPNLGVGAGGDPIKQVDLTAENAIVNTLRQHEISFTLISEESGIKEYGGIPHECYVTTDPIDGTTNLVRGIPFSATSIAVSTEQTLNTVHAALVADLARDAVYVAQKGKGAYCNGKRIVPSMLASLEDAVIGLDLNTYKVQKIAPRLTSLIERTKHIRHFGANALELCYVADGTTDAFIDLRGKLRATDIAAAWLILEEAGARMTTPTNDFLNVKLSPKQRVSFIASGNLQIHKKILDLIQTEKET
jgi:myo-inositol-1(or 4)-monophosphatase